MVWCHEKQLIFVHIPKTGGTTVEYYLELIKGINGYGIIKNVAFQHFNWENYNTLLGEDIYSKYFKFSIIRNPISRCISEYYWTTLGFGYKNNSSFDNFLDNVEDIVKNKKFNETIYHDHFYPQSFFILDENKNSKVDKIYRFEDFSEMNNFLNNYTSEIIIPKQEISKGITKIIPTQNQIDKIYQIYKQDFENFNYDKKI